MVKVCVKRVGESGGIERIADDAAVLAGIIGGHFTGYHLSCCSPLFSGLPLMVLCHDEGKLIGLPYNFTAGYEPIVGDAVIVRYDGHGATVDLTAEDVRKLTYLFPVSGYSEQAARRGRLNLLKPEA